MPRHVSDYNYSLGVGELLFTTIILRWGRFAHMRCTPPLPRSWRLWHPPPRFGFVCAPHAGDVVRSLRCVSTFCEFLSSSTLCSQCVIHVFINLCNVLFRADKIWLNCFLLLSGKCTASWENALLGLVEWKSCMISCMTSVHPILVLFSLT